MTGVQTCALPISPKHYRSFQPVIKLQPTDLIYREENSRAAPRKGIDVSQGLMHGVVNECGHYYFVISGHFGYNKISEMSGYFVISEMSGYNKIIVAASIDNTMTGVVNELFIETPVMVWIQKNLKRIHIHILLCESFP